MQSASLAVDAALCYTGAHWGAETAVLFRLAGRLASPLRFGSSPWATGSLGIGSHDHRQ